MASGPVPLAVSQATNDDRVIRVIIACGYDGPSMAHLQMPQERDYGWPLKPTSSTHFEIVTRPNGQFCVILNHSLLRGCTSEMIHWWFLHFPTLEVTLHDVPGYQESTVPAYYLWHPSDHYAATLKGVLGPGATSQTGAAIHIQEAMQYKKHGWKYPVNSALRIFYCTDDGWAMGKQLPIFGPAMMLRIHYRDVQSQGQVVGVHYHYEIVIGVGGNHAVARRLNHRVTRHFSPEFFEAWHLHNTIEVGTFENFLPALHAQRGDLESIMYSRDMNPIGAEEPPQSGHDRPLFERRVQGYRNAADAHDYQAWDQPSFLASG